MKIGEASALADTAEALMLKDCDEAMAITASGVPTTIEQKARWRRNGAYAASLCTEAVNLLFAATGVTDGSLLKGVRIRGDFAETETVVMRSKTGTVRRIKSTVRNVGARFI